MVNKSGRIGRDGEHTVVAWLGAAGFDSAKREGRRAASLDVVAKDLSVPVEVKRQAVLAIPEWTRKIESVHGPGPWALFVVRRDARKASSHPDLMVVPAAWGAFLLRLWENHIEAVLSDEQEIPCLD